LDEGKEFITVYSVLVIIYFFPKLIWLFSLSRSRVEGLTKKLAAKLVNGHNKDFARKGTAQFSVGQTLCRCTDPRNCTCGSQNITIDRKAELLPKWSFNEFGWSEGQEIDDGILGEALFRGIGAHHAGMDYFQCKMKKLEAIGKEQARDSFFLL
jgi:hypothetical protein